jgi:hypothetical protein
MGQLVVPGALYNVGSGCYAKTSQALTQNTWNNITSTNLDWNCNWPVRTFGSSGAASGIVVPSGYSSRSVTVHCYATITHNSPVGLGIMVLRNNANQGFSGGAPGNFQTFDQAVTMTTGQVISIAIWVNDTGDATVAGQLNLGFYWTT